MKNYIIDTTVLLYDAQALFAFADNNVIIPINVIEDIDHFKKELTERGTNARQTSRYLDDFRKQGSLSEGIAMKNGGSICVTIGTEDLINRLPLDLRHERNHILAIALSVKEARADIPTIIVSKDINLRIKADTLGLIVEDYESEKVDIEELYPGYRSSVAGLEKIEILNRDGAVVLEEQFFPNEYIALHNENMSLKTLGRYDSSQGKVVQIKTRNQGDIWRIEPRNREQVFAMDALLNDAIQMVTLIGKAGTGKTLLAIASSLYKTVDENSFTRVLVSRPTQPMGKDIGYLPGTIEEKLFPWMYPIADNVEYLSKAGGKSKRTLRGFKELVEMGILIIEPLTYIRGRSIHNQYLIVDEAQNLTPHELKTIITRVGDGTKIVVTGDPYQIDNPYIDSSSNGLSYIVEKFKKQDIAAHVTLTKGERSKLSELAANLL
ncbi:MAG: AAA family ATPase [Chitinivibrionales bacterium]|nr:AAA family ATPase [Chitinivibrionales bacterium]